MRAFRAIIRGRVQGVGFRYGTLRQAERLGLAGWVANRPDGAVDVYAQGAPDTMATFLTWLRQGPPMARVDTVDVEEREPDPTLTSFVIR